LKIVGLSIINKSTGETIEAWAVECSKCGHDVFAIAFLEHNKELGDYEHQHIRCVNCNTMFCGTGDCLKDIEGQPMSSLPS